MDPIRHSETFDVLAAELLPTVRQHGLEGIVAKRRSSTYRPGDRSGDWVKLRANRGKELVIGGYMPSSNTFDSILIATTRAASHDMPRGFGADSFQRPDSLCSPSLAVCNSRNAPYVNLAERGKVGARGSLSEEIKLCLWLKPQLVAAIEFLGWTPENRLRHPKFVALRDDGEPKKVIREGLSDSPSGAVRQHSK